MISLSYFHILELNKRETKKDGLQQVSQKKKIHKQIKFKVKS